MSWHYLREPAAESSAACCSGGEPLPPLRSKTTHAKFYCNGKLTESYLASLSGTTCEPSTDTRGVDESTLSRADSRARTFRPQERVKASPEPDPVYGLRWPASYAKYDRDTWAWRTHPCLFPEDSIECCPTLPRWGSMRRGVLSGRTMPEHLTSAIEFGSSLGTPTASNKLPTPTATDAIKGGNVSPRPGAMGLSETTGGQLNPPWVEWLMGWPIGWTDLKPLETDKFRQWLASHGRC